MTLRWPTIEHPRIRSRDDPEGKTESNEFSYQN